MTKHTCFTYFKQPTQDIVLPTKFTFPFYYQPHQISLLAVKQLQQHLLTQAHWQHNFGLAKNDKEGVGKMFGVLVVKNTQGELGFISAFSGKLANSNHLPHFVPPVFDMLKDNSFFMQGQNKLNQLSAKIKNLDNDSKTATLVKTVQDVISQSMLEIKQLKQTNVTARKVRKLKRQEAKQILSEKNARLLNQQLDQESIQQKRHLKNKQDYWEKRVQIAQHNLNCHTAPLTALLAQRKQLSAQLQQQLFEQYQFLNINGKLKSLFDIFKDTAEKKPPSAAGECAAPKLLHYAFKHHYQPIAMAEFWWGKSPKSSIRQHQNFYPACIGKCQPILNHMLKGMPVDDNPLLNNKKNQLAIDIIYQDDDLLIVNKPCFLLSVPGKHIDDSVYNRIKQAYPKATGPLLVHRIDMATSGLLLIALNEIAHKKLQKQFIKRTVKKRYVALLDGIITKDDGLINLPMSGDFYDRPRQIVDTKNGKSAKTQYKVIQRKDGKTKLYFYPITGRTHQLRVHAAHADGLNAPIVGDTLYGQPANRLHLHAEKIEFSHPSSGKLMRFSVDADF